MGKVRNGLSMLTVVKTGTTEPGTIIDMTAGAERLETVSELLELFAQTSYVPVITGTEALLSAHTGKASVQAAGTP